MSPEDVALAFIAIITLVINLIPPVASVVPPEYSIALLSIAAILKAVLGEIKRPPAS